MYRNFTAASQIGICCLASFLLLVTPALAQTGNTIVGPPILVALGSITNLIVVGVGSKLTAPVTARGFPLPTSLAGIAVTLHQSANPQSIPAPILAVTPMSSCANHYPLIREPCDQYTVLTIQIPFELWIPLPEAPPNWASLVVTENGVAGGALEVGAAGYNLRTLAVTHADGTIANWQRPAKSGEVMVLWAVGLGATPTVPTGQATPVPAPVSQLIPELSFEYRPNAPPIAPYCAPAPQCHKPPDLFSGLTPGYAGLYQVNFVVPPPPAGTPPCNVIAGNSETVASNLTVTLIKFVSLGGGQLCVDPAGSSAADSAEVMASAVHSALRRAVPPDII